MVLLISLSLVTLPSYGLAASKKTRKSVSSVSHKRTVKVAIKSKSSQKVSARQRVNLKSIKFRSKSKSNLARVSVKVRKLTYHPQVVPNPSFVEDYDGSQPLMLMSGKALIVNQDTGEVIYAKNTNQPTPIASLTKLMTAMVLLDANLNMQELVTVTDEDIDYIKGTGSRLALGTRLSRNDLLHLALIASENRAASAIGSSYPGGRMQFIKKMNAKAQFLGLKNTHFADPTGLDSQNISTAEDLVRMVKAAYEYEAIRQITTSTNHEVYVPGYDNMMTFNNTNGLVRNSDWQIGLSKTGFISEAGRCLVMQATIADQPMIIVLLDSYGKYSRIGDANRIRKWVEYNSVPVLTTTGHSEEIIADKAT